MEPGLDDLRTIKRHCGLTKKREAPLGGLSCSKIVSTPRRDLMFLARLPLPHTFLFHSLSALFSPPPSLPPPISGVPLQHSNFAVGCNRMRGKWAICMRGEREQQQQQQ